MENESSHRHACQCMKHENNFDFLRFVLAFTVFLVEKRWLKKSSHYVVAADQPKQPTEANAK